jgi:hypothetical protein
MKGVGDSSDNIKAGRIIRTQRTLSEQISPDSIDKALYYFDKCCTTLDKYCGSIQNLETN